MEHFPAPMTREESDAFAGRIETQFSEHGYGPWAVEVPGEADFIGYVGLLIHPFNPFDEIGWRLARRFWGRGYATEAARAVLADAFQHMGRDQIDSFTVPANVRSTRVMERIGMTHDTERDFDHPRFPPGHRLSRHVMYSMTAAQWRTAGQGAPPP